MTLHYSTTLRDNQLDQIQTTAGASAKLQLWDSGGTKPANAAAAATGTKLCEIALPATWMGSAAAGSVALAGSWAGTGAAAGNADYFRIVDNAGTTCHVQGDVSYTASAWAPSTAYTVGQKVSANGNVYNCTTAGNSAASGNGPSGTGTGIADGTAAWDYVSAVGELGLDNINITVGQNVSVSAFTVSAGNA